MNRAIWIIGVLLGSSLGIVFLGGVVLYLRREGGRPMWPAIPHAVIDASGDALIRSAFCSGAVENLLI